MLIRQLSGTPDDLEQLSARISGESSADHGGNCPRFTSVSWESVGQCGCLKRASASHYFKCIFTPTN